MKNALLFLFLLNFGVAVAQKDTLQLHGMINLQGRHQTGNLNQFSANLLTNVSLVNNKWHSRFSVNYTYAKIEGFNAVNDFWSNAIIKYKHSNRVYPVGVVYSGFAKSFGIEQANVVGVGVGVHIVEKSPMKYLNFNITGGYSSFRYSLVKNKQDAVINAFISSNTNFFKSKLELNWELHVFHLPKNEISISGAQNNVRIFVPIKKSIKLTVSHQYIYNSYVNPDVSKVNTMLLFGISIQK